MATTSEKLRARRTELGRTQAEIAQAADMSTVQYNGYENDRHEPNDATMLRLAKALKSKPDDLWYDSEEDPYSASGLLIALKERVAEDLGLQTKQVSVSITLN